MRDQPPDQRIAWKPTGKAPQEEKEAKEGEGGEDAETEPYEALMYVFFATFMGSVTSWVLSRNILSLGCVPYTCAMLIEGIILSVMHDWSGRKLGMLSRSIEMWLNIPPHLLFYTFLPALVFPDAMKLNFFMAQRCFWECFVLAGPGVLVGAFLTRKCQCTSFPTTGTSRLPWLSVLSSALPTPWLL
jgi:hypothetical protein